MKLKGKISLLINQEYTTIEVVDDKASITFIKITMTANQLSEALSRVARVECDLEVMGLDRIGKTNENDTFEFEIPEVLASSRNAEKLREMAQALLKDGWIASDYFSSQNSFFMREGKQMARCTIRRWI